MPKSTFRIFDGPGTINSDDEIDFDPESDSDVEIKPQKKQTGSKSDDFCSDFSFMGSKQEVQTDTWDDIRKYLKCSKVKKVLNTDKKIAEALQARVKVAENGKDGDALQACSSLDEIIPEDDDDAIDNIRVKENDKILKHREEEIKAKKVAKGGIKKQTTKFFEYPENGDISETFHSMNLSRPLLKAIDGIGFDQPTPIQTMAIPYALAGRDICGCAATGTGKTAAYMLPILERLLFKPKNDSITRVLVLVPTRELGIQVYKVSKQLAQFSSVYVALSVGGLDGKSQEVVLRKCPDIVIATPGRLIDHLINTPSFSIDRIEILVLDEADRMLDEYFADQIKEIVRQCSYTHQTMLFSATMTAKVKDLAAVSLKNPVKVFVNNNTDVAQNLRQEFIRLRPRYEDRREAVVAYLVSRVFRDHCMVFAQTKALCHRLHIQLGLLGIRVTELHGDLNQLMRIEALRKFREEEVDILIATDVAARGLDIVGVKTVINYTVPYTYTSYVHRVGRTARAGFCGRSVTIAADADFRRVKEIKKMSRSIVYQRVINLEHLELYRKKLDELEETVTKILSEEKAEVFIKEADKDIEKLETKLHNKPAKKESERHWFKTNIEKNKEKKRLAAFARKELDPNNEDGFRKKGEMSEEAKDKALWQQAGIHARHAKKRSRSKKLSAVPKPSESANQDESMKRKKVKKQKCSFEEELTDIRPAAIKKFRKGPSFLEQKEAFLKKNPGKKYSHKNFKKQHRPVGRK